MLPKTDLYLRVTCSALLANSGPLCVMKYDLSREVSNQKAKYDAPLLLPACRRLFPVLTIQEMGDV